MILCQDRRGLLAFTPRTEPAGRLGDDQRAYHDEHGRRELEAQRQPECQLRRRFVGGVGNARGQNRPRIEEAVVIPDDASTPL